MGFIYTDLPPKLNLKSSAVFPYPLFFSSVCVNRVPAETATLELFKLNQ